MRPPSSPPAHLGAALRGAVDRLRARCPSPFAEIAVLTPSAANGVLAQQQLALTGPTLRVTFLTPETLIQGLGEEPLLDAGLRPAPGGWAQAALGALLRRGSREIMGPYAAALARPGWASAVTQSAQRLRAAHVRPQQLEDLAKARPEHAARLRVLHASLSHLERRLAEEGLYDLPMVCAAALSGPQRGAAIPATRPSAAIILGDRELPVCLHDALKAWLAARPTLALNVPPLSHVPPAPRGLRAALPEGAEAFEVPVDDQGSLGALKARLFLTPDGPSAPEDGRVTLARTPDEVREIAEVTRAVQRAIRDGVALDQIAVALPDAKETLTLVQQMRAAQIPCAWFTGPSLRQSAPARLLLAALELSLLHDGASAWYALLRTPSLKIHEQINERCMQGAAQWRAALSRCEADGGPGLKAAILEWGKGGGEERQQAAEGLVIAIEGLEAALAGMDQPGTLGAHARRWRAFMEAWSGPSVERKHLFDVLEAWGEPQLGDTLPATAALEELRAALEAQEVCRGQLTKPRVLIAPPMLLLGGAFQRVFVVGLGEKRFPLDPGEDVLLPDALIEALNAQGARLEVSAHQEDMERRRFAAALSACADQAWLSSPRFDMLEDRPQLPGALMLAALTALRGAPGSYEALERRERFVGSRSSSAPEVPVEAIGEGEYLISMAQLQPEVALRRLAQEPQARRLLMLHRSIARAARGEGLDAFTGLVDPASMLIPGLDGEALSPRALMMLMRQPATFFARYVLGAWRASRFQGAYDPLERYTLQRLALQAAEAALLRGEGGEEGWEAAWVEIIGEVTRHRPHITAESLETAQRVAKAQVNGLLEGDLEMYPLKAEAAAPDDSLPWRLEVDALLHHQHLCALEDKVEKPKRGQSLVDVRADLALAAIACQQPGFEVVDRSGQRVSQTLGAQDIEDLQAELRESTAQAQRGEFTSVGGPFALGAERED